MSPEIAGAVENSPQPWFEGTQSDTSPQLTQAETEKGGMVAPGQENLVEEFAREQEKAQEEEAILGKFKSPQELAKAYAELQRKMGQQSGQKPGDSPAVDDAPAETAGEGYSAEQAAEVYGKEAVENLASKGLNLADLMWKADSGEDISEHYGTLAETFNVPETVVRNYVGKAQGAPSDGGGLSDADATAILESVGGQDQFNALSGWAKSNLSQDELASYNAAVDSGNKDAITWALKAMQARQGSNDAVVEPQLYGGGTPTDNTMRFESQQQVLDAMNKRNDRGQRLYDIDEAYRNKVQMVLAASDVF
jgi:hypothetical protein